MSACGKLPVAVALAVLGAGVLLACGAWAKSYSPAADDAFWDSVKSCERADEVGAYREQFPSGRHLQKALECLAWLGLGPCRGTHKLRSFLEFQWRFPSGRYAVVARACIDRLEEEDRQSQEVERLLATCAAHVKAKRLTTGKGGTAVPCYREVLAKDPDNPKALAGLQEVFEIYEGWARTMLKRGDLAKARQYADILKRLNPISPATVALRADIHWTERRGRAGREFQDCAVCPKMVVVPVGSFMMGSPPNEEGREDDEGPQHRVTIGDAFAVGKYEVTFAEWDACFAAGGCSQSPNDAGWGRGRRPVIGVTWHDAQEYVNWLSDRTGKPYRLLSEAEWEYAARAGTDAIYHWGDAVGENRANCYGCGSRSDDKSTAPVGSFAPNGFGLHDMHGNVWEWVEDCQQGDYEGAPSDGSAWTTGGNCSWRARRGGAWSGTATYARSANRASANSNIYLSATGFRVALTQILPSER